MTSIAGACAACRAPLAAEAVFCAACGTRADGPAPPPGPDEGLGSTTTGALDPLAPAADALAPLMPRLFPDPDPPPASAAPPVPDFPAGLDAYRTRLREVFGYPDFRSGQADVLAALAARDVLGVMPTGSGKSLCYVLPALELGRTLVVSPLIALMQDQVEALQARGVAATFVNSTLDRAEAGRRLRDFAAGRVPLLYMAPERLALPATLELLRAAGVRLLVVDEAHCISEWGHDFRPDYLSLGPARVRLGEPRTLALTATADARVRRDILARLGVGGGRAAEVVTSFDRPNLRLAVVPVEAEAGRTQWLVRYARERPGQPGIVYARTRRAVEDTAAALAAAGVRAGAYHAGMPAPERAAVQRRFLSGALPVLVATNAFGMGVDKPDVRYVVHASLPGRLEAYYQEAGRAGRDGEPAACTLLYARRDRALQRRFIDQAHPDGEGLRALWRRLVHAQRAAGARPLTPAEAQDAARAAGEEAGLPAALGALRAGGLVEPGVVRLRALDPEAALDATPIEERRRYAESRLAQMVEYAETGGCRRAHILGYFGEQAPAHCTGCDNCAGDAVAPTADYPQELFEALLALRAEVADAGGRPPYMVFEERTARELATYRPRDEHALLATWGLGETRVRWFGERLLTAVRAWETEHPDAPPAPAPPGASSPAARRPSEGAPAVAFDDPLYERLRAWRRERARQDGVPAYTLFSDRTARALAAARPADEDALRAVWGLGDSRVRAFGGELLALVRGDSAPAALTAAGTAHAD